MRIGIMSDLHLGNRQYGLREREEDFYRQYKIAINDFKYAGLDAVIIAGDIFDTSRPSPRALKVFMNGVHELNDSGIKVLNVIGNHSMIQSPDFVTADEFIWSALPATSIVEQQYMLLDGKNNYFEKDGVGIFGLPFHFNHDIEAFQEKVTELNDFAKSLNNLDKRILVLHQSFKEFCGFLGEELSIYDIDTDSFDLIVCGHIHERKLYQLENGTIFLQPGSLERLSLAEARDEEIQGKGIYMFDTDFMDMEYIANNFNPIKSSRRFYIADMYINSSDEVDEIRKEIMDEVKECSIPPVLFLTVHDTSKSFSLLMDLVRDCKSDWLTVRFKYFDESTKEEYMINTPDGLPPVREGLNLALNPLDDDEARFGLDLFDILKSNGDASQLITDFKTKKITQQQALCLMQDPTWIQKMEQYFNDL